MNPPKPLVYLFKFVIERGITGTFSYLEPQFNTPRPLLQPLLQHPIQITTARVGPWTCHCTSSCIRSLCKHTTTWSMEWPKSTSAPNTIQFFRDRFRIKRGGQVFWLAFRSCSWHFLCLDLHADRACGHWLQLLSVKGTGTSNTHRVPHNVTIYHLHIGYIHQRGLLPVKFVQAGLTLGQVDVCWGRPSAEQISWPMHGLHPNPFSEMKWLDFMTVYLQLSI